MKRHWIMLLLLLSAPVAARDAGDTGLVRICFPTPSRSARLDQYNPPDEYHQKRLERWRREGQLAREAALKRREEERKFFEALVRENQRKIAEKEATARRARAREEEARRVKAKAEEMIEEKR